MNIKKTICLITIFFSLLSASDIITFQGRLIDSTGAAVNGYKQMGFKIHNAATGDDTAIMRIPHKEVLCNDGNYAVEINLSTAKEADGKDFVGVDATKVSQEATLRLNNNNIWIEVYVGDRGAEVFDTDSVFKMSPRINLTATPYAISTQQIQGLKIKRNAGDMELSY